jgi:polyhydroxyalkanoate synthesis regulator phasin
MFEVINKAFLIGVGLAATAGEKVEELAKELAEKGKLSESEAKKLADNMVAKSAKARKDLKAQVEKWLEQSIHKMHLPTKDDIDSLKARIAKLEKAGKKK